MINPHNIQANLTHEREIGIHLLRPSEIVPLGVRLEGTVRDTFDEKLFVTFQKEFRRRVEFVGLPPLSCRAKSRHLSVFVNAIQMQEHSATSRSE